MKALVLLSGGMDSTVTLAMAKQECNEVYLLLNLFLNQKKNWLMKAGFIFCEKYLNREIKK